MFAYLNIKPFGDYNYLPVDAVDQYNNFLEFFRGIFLEDNNIFYSLSKAIGGEMYGTFLYYLVSPYNFITLLFSKENIRTCI